MINSLSGFSWAVPGAVNRAVAALADEMFSYTGTGGGREGEGRGK